MAGSVFEKRLDRLEPSRGALANSGRRGPWLWITAIGLFVVAAVAAAGSGGFGTAAAQAWHDHVLPAFLDIYMSGLAWCA